MRRNLVFLVMLTAFAATAVPQMASAQATTPFRQLGRAAIFGSTIDPPMNPAIVIARLMTFDRDHDGRLVKSELPERMQNLLVGDSSGDQALDRDEILAMARPAPPAPVAATATVPGLRGGGGSYTFGDQVSLSTRSHVEGALDDMRLTPIQHEQALAIVRPFMDALEADAEAVLLKELEPLIEQGQLASFKMMLERHMTGSNRPAQFMTRPDGTRIQINLRFVPDLAQMLNNFGLPLQQASLALAALDAFKVRIRPADADRAVLVRALKNVLNDEERENFDAALQRRPLVKANAMFAGASFITGVVVPPPPPAPALRALPGDVVSPEIVRPLVLKP
jgi:hypothetical protein